VFHEKWEGRVMALVRALGAQGAFNIDTSRFYREALPPRLESFEYGERSSPVVFLNELLKQPK